MEAINDTSEEGIEKALSEVMSEHSSCQKDVYPPIRYLLTGSHAGATVVDIMTILGKDRVVQRLNQLESTHN